MTPKRNYLSIPSVSIVVVLVLIVHVDPSLGYSNRLLRFARNDPKWKIPMNIYDLFKLKRTGLETIGRSSGFDYDDGK